MSLRVKVFVAVALVALSLTGGESARARTISINPDRYQNEVLSLGDVEDCLVIESAARAHARMSWQPILIPDVLRLNPQPCPLATPNVSNLSFVRTGKSMPGVRTLIIGLASEGNPGNIIRRLSIRLLVGPVDDEIW